MISIIYIALIEDSIEKTFGIFDPNTFKAKEYNITSYTAAHITYIENLQRILYFSDSTTVVFRNNTFEAAKESLKTLEALMIEMQKIHSDNIEYLPADYKIHYT